MMKKIYKPALLIGLAALLLSFSIDKGVNFQNNGLAQVEKTSQESKKPIFILVGANYCGLCQKMEAEMGRNNNVGEFYNSHFVCTYMDARDVVNHYRLTNWGIERLPVVIFMNSKGKIIYKKYGYLDGPKLMAEGQKAYDINAAEVTKDEQKASGVSGVIQKVAAPGDIEE